MPPTISARRCGSPGEGDKARTAIMVFPELGLSSYAIEDLLLQDALLDQVERSVAKVVEASKTLFPILVVGAPLRVTDRLYNTAIVIHRGKILGVVPKTYLPNYREFYEKRHFVSGANTITNEIELAGQTAPFGTDLLFRSTGSVPITFHVEICEDIWMPVPPSSHAALAGAEVLLNLSASNITIGKAEMRRLLCGSQSARASAAYAYSASGPGESTTDLAWDGHAAIYECGDQLAESARFEKDSTIVTADVDLGRIRQERLRNGGFADNARAGEGPGRALPHRRVRARCAEGERGAGAADRALPLRAVRSGQAARQLLRGLQHPGPGPGAAPAVEPAPRTRSSACRAASIRRMR